ncbi:transporter [Thalassospira profundimaris]|uniref:Transporter n=1 Tax=Thalassospira profundimaris TaxID=502049 RepID=A0A367WYR8_9PROT|nr:sugar ABC transporter permease [Thalassospira profundimaris]RCK45651.1 transporter [Thalassospira profundimaris]
MNTASTNTPPQSPAKSPVPGGKKRRIGPMERREARLAYSLLLPTFVIVLGIVLFPLIANFWISAKPVTLGDLRAPRIIASERLRGHLEKAGDEAKIEYRLRNSSQTADIKNVTLTDTLPAGLSLAKADSHCRVEDRKISCQLGDWKGGARERLSIGVKADQSYIDNPVRPRVSEPVLSGTADNILTNSEFTFDNFINVFNSREFWSVFWVTIAYTVFGTGGALVLGLFAAQLLNKKFAGRSILRGLFLFPYVAPVIAVAFTWLILLDPFSGTFNAMLQKMNIAQEGINFFGSRSVPVTFFGITFEFPLALATVIAFEAWRYFPLSFLFILARMQSISSDMYEAAEVDGATPLQQFWHISLPQLIGILSTLFLLRFIWTFNKFDDIFLLTGGAAGTRTLTVDVYEQGFALSNLGAGAAVAVVIFFMLLIFAVVYFRFVHREDS